ncbi:putative inositol phosphokinase (IPK) family protein [Lyophyllum shimeji]|uniref:Kinase n=1 Tax=Lyophyllum shimeji TaxID=47721 RepID=A0A9P3PGW4_LYOSH|nr:putative inositol phosphokinase (IPK) family protein [Lyophyllum shimeji]
MAALSTSAAKPLTSQVGGHAGVLATEDGSLIIKPALPLEVQFYQALQQSPSLEALRPFIPKFYGMLKLEGQLDEEKSAEEGNISVTPVDAPQKESLVLENISHPFLKPNILDIKLGTALYDEDAPPAKVERMIETAKNTTSSETGIRLTGFQVYNNTTSEPVITPKSYGKSIKPADLPNGIARFFPVGAMPPKEGGEAPDGVSPSGLPLTTLLPLLRGIREDIEEIREVCAELEMRMVGASLLIVYEADWERAEAGLKYLEQDSDEESEDEEEEDEEGDGQKKRPGPPYIVKLIDFAHTRLKPGQGADEGVLLGMDTVLKLIDGRIAQLE